MIRVVPAVGSYAAQRTPSLYKLVTDVPTSLSRGIACALGATTANSKASNTATALLDEWPAGRIVQMPSTVGLTPYPP
jgi:hypothetical protein